MLTLAYKDEWELKQRYDTQKTLREFKLNGHLYQFQGTEASGENRLKIYHSSEDQHTLNLHIRENTLFHISGFYKVST